MLQACLNGDRPRGAGPAVPITAIELARDAAAVARAGAEALHFHPRAPDGSESLQPEHVAEALNAVRRSVPGMPIGISTRSPIAPGGRARHAPMRAWSVLPDYVSVNLIEEDAPEVIDLMLAMGVGVEAGLWSRADAVRFVALPSSRQCLRALIEINEQDLADGLTVARAIVDVLDNSGREAPRLLHGCDATMWPIYRESIRRGCDGRIGLEDGLTLPDGEPAEGNLAQIAAAAAMNRRSSGVAAP